MCLYECSVNRHLESSHSKKGMRMHSCRFSKSEQPRQNLLVINIHHTKSAKKVFLSCAVFILKIDTHVSLYFSCSSMTLDILGNVLAAALALGTNFSTCVKCSLLSNLKMPYSMYIDKGKVMNSVWRGAILTSLTKHTYETNKFIFILSFPKVFMNI